MEFTEIDEFNHARETEESEQFRYGSTWKYLFKRKHRHKIDYKPSFKHIILGYLFQINDNLMCLWMLVTLNEVQKEIQPKEIFHQLVDYLHQCFALFGLERDVVHREDAGVADAEED